MSENAPSLDDIAAEWAVKVDAGPLAPGEDAALEAWLKVDARHLGAFARAKAALAFADAERITGGRGAEEPALSRRKFFWAAGLAASFALVAPLLYRVLLPETKATQIGEIRVVPLSDGSVVTLNTNSEIDVHYTEDRREIRLVQGEALFDVAHDAKRPFFVRAGDTEVRAVGTSFTVRLLPDQPVQVLVREGVVEVNRPDTPVAPAVRVNANVRAIAPIRAPIITASLPPAEVTRSLAWREGRIAFEGETVRQAASEFARYSETRIVINAPDVESQTVAGLFITNDPVTFAKAVAASFNLKMQVSENEIRLSH